MSPKPPVVTRWNGIELLPKASRTRRRRVIRGHQEAPTVHQVNGGVGGGEPEVLARDPCDDGIDPDRLDVPAAARERAGRRAAAEPDEQHVTGLVEEIHRQRPTWT